MKKIVLIGIFATFISCKKNEAIHNTDEQLSTSTEKKVSEQKSVQTETTVASNTDCGLEKFLSDPKTPKLAKELFENKAKNDDQALEFFEMLKSSDERERNFYFRVITNSYKVADGAYAEGLGYKGLDYLENNTVAFTGYFENQKCFTDNDIKTWTSIVMLEFSLLYENETSTNMANDLISKMNRNCKNCTPSQKETLVKFSHYLTDKWENYISIE